MNTYLSLLRGINVGGKNRLPMKLLATLLEDLEAQQVQTYIQSGNAVLQHSSTDLPALSRRIESAVEEACEFEPRVLTMGKDDLERAITFNPFPKAESEPKTLHVYFLEAVPQTANVDKLEVIKSSSENFVLLKNLFYLHAPEGIGRSKLAAGVEKLLGVAATARNWRTVCKLMDIVPQIS